MNLQSLTFDVVVLGTGPAGSTVAKKASESGHSVAIVESREFGGTCALRGCNPRKVYANAASVVDQVRRADGGLIADKGIAIEWPRLFKFKNSFTEPIAAVGMSENQARESGRKFDVRFKETSAASSVRKTGKTVAGFKLIIEKDTDLLLGAHLLGPAAEETINLFALAMRFDLTATDLKSTLFAFPTFAADVRKMI